LLPQNALPTIFGDGVPNLLLQGSLRSADIPSVQMPGRLSVSYEGGAGSGIQPNTVNPPQSVSSQEDPDQAFAELASQASQSLMAVSESLFPELAMAASGVRTQIANGEERKVSSSVLLPLREPSHAAPLCYTRRACARSNCARSAALNTGVSACSACPQPEA
jgi:hypothetical protein